QRGAAAQRRADAPGGGRPHAPAGGARGGLRGHLPGALPRRLRGRRQGRPLRRARLPDLPRRARRERPRRRRRAVQPRATMGGGAEVKLGLMTAAFARLDLEQVAAWAAANGYEMLEVACWPAAGGERRRYAGVSHIDVERLDAGRVRDTLERHGLEISSLAYYPNNRHPDPAQRRAAHAHLRRVIDAAAALGVPTVGTFVGRDQTRTLPDNFREFKRVWPRLVAYAESKGVRIAIENCPMIFSYDEWPGGTNLAATPAAWDEMFSLVPSASFGLNLDPSHL